MVMSGCRKAVWLEHRQLLTGREDMDDIVASLVKIREFSEEVKQSTVGPRS
jgi:hypothetical protein